MLENATTRRPPPPPAPAPVTTETEEATREAATAIIAPFPVDAIDDDAMVEATIIISMVEDDAVAGTAFMVRRWGRRWSL